MTQGAQRSNKTGPAILSEEVPLGVVVLTEQEAAKVLKCSVPGLRRMRREGRGPRWTRLGKLVRYRSDWLREFLEENAR
jgi:excisionase family DNA binding protein